MVSYGGQKRANVNSSPRQMVSHLASGQIDSENKENAEKIENMIQDTLAFLGEKQTWTCYHDQSNAHKTQKPKTNVLHGLRLLLITFSHWYVYNPQTLCLSSSFQI